MSQYDLYRDLARAIYALAIDATEARDPKRTAQVDAIARAAFAPLREELGGHTPIFDILECLDFKAPDDGHWVGNLKDLKELKEIYPEVLG